MDITPPPNHIKTCGAASKMTIVLYVYNTNSIICKP